MGARKLEAKKFLQFVWLNVNRMTLALYRVLELPHSNISKYQLLSPLVCKTAPCSSRSLKTEQSLFAKIALSLHLASLALAYANPRARIIDAIKQHFLAPHKDVVPAPLSNRR